MPFLPWVPTAGNAPVPLSPGNGGTGGQLPWVAADDGFLGYNSSPDTASGGGLLVVSVAYLARLPVRVPTLISNLWVDVSTIGAGTANGFSGMWIVSGATGAVLAQSADQTATFTGTTGWKQIPMTVPVQVPAGPPFPYAVTLSNLLTTQVTLLRQLNTVANSPQAVANVSTLRWAGQAAFGTAVGAVTLASNAPNANSIVVGWS